MGLRSDMEAKNSGRKWLLVELHPNLIGQMQQAKILQRPNHSAITDFVQLGATTNLRSPQTL